MKKKIVFAGFRHGHILSLYNAASASPKLEIAGACEEDAQTVENLKKSNPDVAITAVSFDALLAGTPCDIVAIGDYYAKRGSLAIRALRAGKHVVADKPLCTSLEELAEIEKLSAKNGLKVGCMLDLRTGDTFAAAKEFVRSGKLGTVTQIQFGGQHPLMRGTRPGWYFEAGKHGGTINDIAIHAIDYIPWLTGSDFKAFRAARTWKAFDQENDGFNDSAQFMLELENGCGVLGDVSYSVPDSLGYRNPQYWRFTVWGTKGIIEFNCIEKKITAYINGEKEPRTLIPAPFAGSNYLDSFLADIDGAAPELNTAVVLKRTRQALELQKLADSAAR